MSRSLPLGDPAEAITSSTPQEPHRSATVTVYDPAMCCPTGICGPGVDPSLLAIARDLRWLEKQGVTVERFGLAQQPDAFVASARVAGLIQAFGDGALPAVLVKDTVLCYGRYPTRDELVHALASTATTPAPAPPCCPPGSGCC
jgi:hypothetical protein